MNIEELRSFCLNLPHVEEDVKWGNDLCFTIGKKMFCVTGLESEEFSLSLKVTPEEFESLTLQEGINPAAYVARYKWISIKGEDRLTTTEWRYYIEQSYRLVKEKLPKKTIENLSWVELP